MQKVLEAETPMKSLATQIEEAAGFYRPMGPPSPAFIDGAHFGYSLAVEMLRSYGFTSGASANYLADWLESMKEKGE